jgi:GTP pyrophosphokinase
MMAAIGDGTLDINVIKEYILSEDQRRAEALEAAQAAEAAKAFHEGEGDGHDDILVINAKDLKGLYYKMAKCCHPVFGDDVFGFVTRTSGITIHRISCPNASRLIENYPYRIQKVRWADSPSSGSFQVTLRITCSQDNSVINLIMDIVNNFKTSVRSFNILEDNRRGTSDIIMKISVPSNSELDKVMSQLRLLRQVIKVSRQ